MVDTSEELHKGTPILFPQHLVNEINSHMFPITIMLITSCKSCQNLICKFTATNIESPPSGI